MYKTHVVFAGNPGMGKSFILNSLIGQVKFKSGMNIVEGMTSVLQRYDARNYVYFDTPGLDDVNNRRRAAHEISKALKGGCEMKLIFVVTFESGRIRSQDLATISLVLKAIEKEGVNTKQRFSVIINKCSPVLMRQSKNMRVREKIRASFGGEIILKNIEFFPRIPEADDQSDYLLNDNREYANFVRSAPIMALPKTANVKVDPRNFDEISEQYETKLKVLEAKLKEFDDEPNDATWLLMLQSYLNTATVALASLCCLS